MSLSLDLVVKKVESSGTYRLFDVSPAYTATEMVMTTTAITSASDYTFYGGEHITIFYSPDDLTLTRTPSGGGVSYEMTTKLVLLDGDQRASTFTATTTASSDITLYIFKS